MSVAPADGDWGRWSREAVAELQRRNDALKRDLGLAEETPYHWDLDRGTLRFMVGDQSVHVPIQCVGTVFRSAGTFLWGWANGSLPPAVTHEMRRVHAFGHAHDLPLLVDGEWNGGHPEALEMLAISARVLDARAGWTDTTDDGSIYFVIQAGR